MSNYRITYAQNKEDIILSAFFAHLKKGFYVDVGANHPDTLSVTKYFYDQGWNGINIEPSPTLYKEITQQRPRDINLNIGAADKPGELTLREYPEGDGLSTFSVEAQKSYQEPTSEYHRNTGRFEDRVVDVKPLSQIFDEIKVETINFMNIDVEGFEYQVIKGNNWAKYRPQVICIEANHIVQDWRPLLEKAHYDLVFFDGLNNYYVAHECSKIAQNFSYVRTVLLDDRPILPAAVNEQLLRGQQLQQKIEHKLAQQELVAQNLQSEIYSLNNLLAARKRIRSLVKQLAVAINGVILVQIERLNRPKLKKQLPLAVVESDSTKKLLSQVRLYDLGHYYEAGSVRPLSYRVLYGSYTALYRVAKLGARKLIRVARRRKQ